MKHKVVIKDDALFQMVTAGLEAYCIRHPGKRSTGIECFGRLWGSYTENARSSSLIVKSMTVDTSARMNNGWTENNQDTQALKMQVAELFAHRFQYLGDFHTHPYQQNEKNSRLTAQELRKQELFRFSDGDVENSLLSLPIEGSDRMLSIVLTLFRMSRVNTELDGRIDENTLEFSVGNVKCWLRAQVYNVSGQVAERTVLEADHAEWFGLMSSDFRHNASLADA